ETHDYRTAFLGSLKVGVRLVLAAGGGQRLVELTVMTTTPGFTAVVKAGSSESGPFEPVSSSQTVDGTATYSLRVDPAQRYYVLWITHLGSALRAEIDEVTAR